MKQIICQDRHKISPELWICEYSPTQSCFHIDTLAKSLEVNRRSLAAGRPADYIPLYIARSSEEARAFAEQWEAAHGW